MGLTTSTKRRIKCQKFIKNKYIFKSMKVTALSFKLLSYVRIIKNEKKQNIYFFLLLY